MHARLSVALLRKLENYETGYTCMVLTTVHAVQPRLHMLTHNFIV